MTSGGLGILGFVGGLGLFFHGLYTLDITNAGFGLLMVLLFGVAPYLELREALRRRNKR